MKSVVGAVSYMALWAGLYVTGAAVYLGQISGQLQEWTRADITVLLYCLLASTGVYLLDRVKLRDAWLDPADKAAHPERFEFIAERSGQVRIVAALLLVASTAIGWTLSQLLALLTPVACIGVLAYAGKPKKDRARIKDVLFLKNSFVACGITAFALVLVVGTAKGFSLAGARSVLDPATLWPVVFATFTLGVRVFADAVLCDLDDEVSDREHGTVTLPTQLGRQPARDVAWILRLAVAVALWFVPLGPVEPRRAWAVITVLSSVGLRVWNPLRVRDYVDARLALEAMLVSMILALW